mgnify:CR=1 FL=1
MEKRRLGDKDSLRKWKGKVPESARRLSWRLVLNVQVQRRMAEF